MKGIQTVRRRSDLEQKDALPLKKMNSYVMRCAKPNLKVGKPNFTSKQKNVNLSHFYRNWVLITFT